jgi:hypothetical protein
MLVNVDSPYHQKLARLMRARRTRRNILQQRVEAGTLSTRSRWKKTIEDVNFDFPELSLEDLRLLFFGTYKIKQARTYVEEHLDPDGDYIIELGDDNDDILRCTIQSRHSNATKYKAWIQYSLSGDPIVAWYCTCPAGAITVGCCSHVVSVVWYLSYARHHNFEPSKGRRRIRQAILERTIESDEEREVDDDDNSETDDD